MEIAIDFDGTCVKHEYPKIGSDIGAVPILKELVKNGHNLILFTMRSGNELQEAINWFKQNDIPLYGVNTNPTQHEWTSSPKAYAQLFIDDAGIGTPLIYSTRDVEYSGRPFVDWVAVREILIGMDIIKI